MPSGSEFNVFPKCDTPAWTLQLIITAFLSPAPFSSASALMWPSRNLHFHPSLTFRFKSGQNDPFFITSPTILKMSVRFKRVDRDNNQRFHLHIQAEGIFWHDTCKNWLFLLNIIRFCLILGLVQLMLNYFDIFRHQALILARNQMIKPSLWTLSVSG